MKNKDQNNKWFTPSESPTPKESIRGSSISHFIEESQTLYLFHLIAGISQIILGLGVITVSILGLIEPQWLSTLMIMLASVSAIIGAYLLYITVTRKYDPNALLRNAMRRIMEHKN